MAVEYECGPAPVGEPELRSVGHLLWHQRTGTPVCGLAEAEHKAYDRDYYLRNRVKILAKHKERRARARASGLPDPTSVPLQGAGPPPTRVRPL